MRYYLVSTVTTALGARTADVAGSDHAVVIDLPASAQMLVKVPDAGLPAGSGRTELTAAEVVRYCAAAGINGQALFAGYMLGASLDPHEAVLLGLAPPTP